MEPLLGSLLAVVLGDTDRLEALWVLVAAETSRKSRESVVQSVPLVLTSSRVLRLEEITVRASQPSLMCWRRSSGGGRRSACRR
jgi:hypothetical protein